MLFRNHDEAERAWSEHSMRLSARERGRIHEVSEHAGRAIAVLRNSITEPVGMPELPEIETIVKHLRPQIRGKKILGLQANTPRLFRDHKNPREVARYIIGRKIKNVRRIGKNIVFDLDSGNSLVLHLMMAGRLLLNPKGKRVHDRMLMRLSGNNHLVFNDPRKFGRVRVVRNPESLAGQDPLSISFSKFQKLIGSRQGIIKSLLLNQKILAGIGNIYSDEILWQAGIHPRRKVPTLDEGEMKKLYRAAGKVLKLGIKKGGSSMRDYLRPDGKEGGYYNIRRVYQRAGGKCSRDGGIIRRIKIGSRSAHFCPAHQV